MSPRIEQAGSICTSGLFFIPGFDKIPIIGEVSEIGVWQEIQEGFDFSALLSILLGVIPSLVCITLTKLPVEGKMRFYTSRYAYVMIILNFLGAAYACLY